MNLPKKIVRKIGVFLILTLSVSFFALTSTTPVGAADYKDLSVEDKARAYTYYRALASCMSGLKNEIKASAQYDGLKTDPANGYWYGTGDSSQPDRKGEWWSGDAKNEADVTPKSTTVTGTLGCTEITKTGLSQYWGGVSPADLLKALKYEWNDNDKWIFKGDGSKKSEYLKTFLKSKGVSLEYTPAVEYFVNYNAFVNDNFCNAKDNGTLASQSTSIKNRYDTYNSALNAYEGKTVYKKTTLAQATKTEVRAMTYTGNPSAPQPLQGWYTLYFDNSKDCDTIAANITQNAASYLDAVITKTCSDKGYAGAYLAACKDGVKNSGNANYCNKFAATDVRKACATGQGLQLPPSLSETVFVDTSNPTTPTSSCVVEGIGWIICPVTNFLAGVSDSAFSVIENFLKVDVSLFNVNSGTYQAWSAFRTVANVAFVIAFLFIIYSQLTSTGISNYGIKKTLPRLVIAAILVNASFFVCQLAVDISQIIGGSLTDFLKGIPVGTGDGVSSTPTWTNVMGDILMGSGILLLLGVGAVATASILALSISLPVLLAFLLAVLMTVVILIGRQAGIVILIVLSPLAFVAFLLPNTEQWFKKWYKVFVALLMVYPLIALLYGGGVLASRIIANASVEADGQSKFWLGITALAVSAIPLIMTPSLLKGAMNGMGSIGGKLSGIASKMNGKVGSAANSSSRYGEAKQGLKNRFALNRAARRGQSTFQQKIDKSWAGRSLGLDKGAARAANIVAREDDAEVDAEVARIKLNTNSVNRLDEAERMLQDGIKTGNTTQARAAQRILLGSGNAGISKVQAVYSNPGMQEAMGHAQANGTMNELRSDLNGAGLKGKNNALATFGYSGNHQSFNSHLEAGSTYSSLNPVELAGQSSSNLEKGRASITPSMAQAVLANSGASALLDGTKREFFEKIAAENTLDVTATTQTATQEADTQPASQQQNALGAAERARQTAAQAAQGTSGDGVYAADSQGNISIAHPRNSEPGIPAGQARQTMNEHGQMGIVGQDEDTIERMSR